MDTDAIGHAESGPALRYLALTRHEFAQGGRAVTVEAIVCTEEEWMASRESCSSAWSAVFDGHLVRACRLLDDGLSRGSPATRFFNSGRAAMGVRLWDGG